MGSSAEGITPVVVIAPVKDLGQETAGTFFPYNSVTGTPVAPTGFRHVNTCYRQTKVMKDKGIDARPNVYVCIPSDHVSVANIIENIETLAPYISAYLGGIEGDTIKAMHKDRATQIFTETLTLAKILDTIEETGTSLNSEQVTDWYTECVAEKLLEVIATKNDLKVEELTDVQQSKVKLVIESYLAQFISLASGKTMLSGQQRNKLTKCMVDTGSDTTPLGIRFASRFNKMAAKEEEALRGLEDDLEL